MDATNDDGTTLTNTNADDVAYEIPDVMATDTLIVYMLNTLRVFGDKENIVESFEPETTGTTLPPNSTLQEYSSPPMVARSPEQLMISPTACSHKLLPLVTLRTGKPEIETDGRSELALDTLTFIDADPHAERKLHNWTVNM